MENEIICKKRPQFTLHNKLKAPHFWFKSFLLPHLFLAIITAFASCAVYFNSNLPIVFSFLPLVFALWFSKRGDEWPKRFYILAYTIPLSLVTGLALFELDIYWAVIVLYVLFGIVAGSAIAIWAGITALSVVFFVVSFSPGGPLSAAGALFPGFGIWAILTTLIFILALEFSRILIFRISVIVALILSSAAVHTGFISPPPFSNTQQHNKFEVITLSNQLIPKSYAAILEIVELIEDGSEVFLGENILYANDTKGIEFWCLIAHRTKSKIYLGAMKNTGMGNMILISAENCPEGKIIYQPQVIVPYVTGSLADVINKLQPSIADKHTPIEPKITWIACYEALSLRKWASIAYQHTQSPIVVYSNTTWQERLPARSLLVRFIDLHSSLLSAPQVIHVQNGLSMALREAT